MLRYLILALLSSWPSAFTQKDFLRFPRFYIKIAKVSYDFNPEWIVNVSCNLKPINWERTLVNASVDIVKPLRNITASGQVYRRETRYVPFLVNMTRNACELLNHKGTNFYSRTMLSLINKFSNIPNPKCPITGHVSVKNVFLDSNLLSIPLPLGIYKIVVNATEGYPPQYVGFIEVTVNVEAKYRRMDGLQK